MSSPGYQSKGIINDSLKLKCVSFLLDPEHFEFGSVTTGAYVSPTYFFPEYSIQHLFCNPTYYIKISSVSYFFHNLGEKKPENKLFYHYKVVSKPSNFKK